MKRLLLALILLAAPAGAQELVGFHPDRVAGQREIEERADDWIVADELIVGSERLLTRAHGLPDRPWFRHHLYSPGLYTGYGVKTLPGVREAIEEGEWVKAQAQIDIAAEVLNEYAEQLKRMARATVSRDP